MLPVQMPVDIRRAQLPADCTVVILSWNRRDLLLRSLRALHETNGSRQLEVLVVDNASTDGSPEVVRSQFPGVRLIENDLNLGAAEGRNVGLRAATSELILLLDNDTTIERWQVDVLIDTMKAHPEAGMLACMKVHPTGEPMHTFHIPPPTALNFWFFLMNEWSLIEGTRILKRLLKWGEEIPHQSQDLVEIPYIGGGIMLVRARAVREVGLLDNQIFIYGEDFDWCFRFRQRGWKILYAPKIRVVSGFGTSTIRTKASSLVALRSRRYLFEKHVGRKYLGLYRAIAVLGLVPKLTFYVLRDLLGPQGADLPTREWLLRAIDAIAS